jgi:hypothetical protein
MTEKLTAWLFLMSLIVLTVSTASHRRWSLDARPVLTATLGPSSPPSSTSTLRPAASAAR